MGGSKRNPVFRLGSSKRRTPARQLRPYAARRARSSGRASLLSREINEHSFSRHGVLVRQNPTVPPLAKPSTSRGRFVFEKIDIPGQAPVTVYERVDSLVVDSAGHIVQGKSVERSAKEDNSTRRCARQIEHAFPRRCPSRKFSWPSNMTDLLDIFFRYFGNRANSAASTQIPLHPANDCLAPRVGQSGRQCADSPRRFSLVQAAAHSKNTRYFPRQNSSPSGAATHPALQNEPTPRVLHPFLHAHQARSSFPAGRQYAEVITGDSGSMLDSAFRDRNNCSIAESPRTSTAAKVGWAVLVAATLYVCYFSHLGAIGFVGPDEPRYAWIARDMAETATGSRRASTESPGSRSLRFSIGALRFASSSSAWAKPRAATERDLCAARHACSSLAGAASLRRGNGSLAAAFASNDRRHDRLFSRRLPPTCP